MEVKYIVLVVKIIYHQLFHHLVFCTQILTFKVKAIIAVKASIVEHVFYAVKHFTMRITWYKMLSITYSTE